MKGRRTFCTLQNRGVHSLFDPIIVSCVVLQYCFTAFHLISGSFFLSGSTSDVKLFILDELNNVSISLIVRGKNFLIHTFYANEESTFFFSVFFGRFVCRFAGTNARMHFSSVHLLKRMQWKFLWGVVRDHVVLCLDRNFKWSLQSASTDTRFDCLIEFASMEYLLGVYELLLIVFFLFFLSCTS